MTTPQIVVLNGVGSVGKSSTARALQGMARVPYLHVAMDAFLSMLPEGMMGHPDGLVFETVTEDGHPSVVIHSGPVLDRAMAGMREAVAAMAGAGNRMIVDEVLLGADRQSAYRLALAGFDVRWVGLFASLEVLEARERARGDRAIGLARWQFARVHAGMRYDLEIDTSQLSADAVAARIRDRFDL